MSTSLIVNPVNEKLSIRHLSRVSDLGRRLRLTSIEAEERRDRGDHKVHGQVGSAARHDLRGVEFDSGEAHAAVGFTDAGLDEGAHQRGDDATC